MLTVVVMLVTVTAVFWFLQKTRTGKAMRAYSDNEDLALLSGISPERVVAITWILAAALATIAGTLYGLDKSFRPFTYFQLLLPIFAAAIVGGVGQPLGAIAGGFIIAFSEVMVTYAYKGFLGYFMARAARGARADARHRLQVRGLLHHPRRRAAGAPDRHLPGAGDMSNAPRSSVLYAVMAALIVAVGLFQSWIVALTILQPLPDLGGHGARRQHPVGLCGLFNAGIMGFAALGGVAVVLVSVPPVAGALGAGGWNLGSPALAVLAHASPPRSSCATGCPPTCAAPAGLLTVARRLLRDAHLPRPGHRTPSRRSTRPRAGYLGGLGLPVLISWAVGGLFAAGAA